MPKSFLAQAEYHDRHLLDATGFTMELEVRPPSFRVSSLPFCPILDYLGHVDPSRNTFAYEQDFYFGIGTALHSKAQQAMSYSPLYGQYSFGGWRCPRWADPEDPCHVKIEGPCLRPPNPRCNRPNCVGVWEYVEISFRHRGLSGHLDYLSYYSRDWVPWEFKTAGWWALKGDGIKNLPYPRHIVQVETYNALLELQYGIIPSYYIISYIPRGEPKLHKGKSIKIIWTEERRKARLRELETTYWRKESVDLALYNLKRDKEPNLEEILRRRPCHSAKDYKEKMDMAFFGDAVCEFYDSGECACPSSTAMREVLEEATDTASSNLVKKGHETIVARGL